MRHPIPADRLDLFAAPAGSEGLSTSQVAARRTRFGPNAIADEPRSHWVELLLETARDPMIWFLVATGLLYALIGEKREAMVLIAAIVPLIGMDAYLHRRTRVSTQGLRGRLAVRATVIRDGEIVEIPALELVPGDLVRVATGELFPADGLLVGGDALQVDESSLTGEAFPVRKTSLTEFPSVNLAIDAAQWASAGTRVLTGEALVRIVTTGTQTLYGEIVRSAFADGRSRTRLQQAIDRLVLLLVIAAVGMCILLGVVRLWQGYGVVDALVSAVTLAVAAIPEEFPVVFTFFLGVGVYRLARRQALVRRAVAVENIGRVSCLCTDKTGTLTAGRLSLEHRVPADGVSELTLLQKAALASRVESRDPLDEAILKSVGPVESNESRIALFPFTEDRRREVAIYRAGDRATAVMKGAPEVVFARCGLDAVQSELWRKRSDELAAAHKVIACAWRDLDPNNYAGEEPNGGFKLGGLLAFEDPIREGARDAVKQADAVGIRLIMVTGDHPANALSIAKDVGIGGPRPVVLLGEDFERAILERGSNFLSELDILARAMPAQKLALVRALQQAGEVVAVTGDGVNDVPALKAADVGIAMGESATQSAREAGAIVLLDDNLRTIVNAVQEGRQLFLNLRLSFAYLLVVHLPLVSSAALIPLTGHPLLYLPIHIVWLELIIHPTAMLAFQAAADGRRAERAPARFFTSGNWLGIVGAGVLITVAVVMGFNRALAISGSTEHARTLSLVILILAGSACAALLTRLANRAAAVIVGTTLASTLLLTQWRPLAALLELQPLHLNDWLIATAAAVLAAAPILLLRPVTMAPR